MEIGHYSVSVQAEPHGTTGTGTTQGAAYSGPNQTNEHVRSVICLDPWQEAASPVPRGPLV